MFKTEVMASSPGNSYMINNIEFESKLQLRVLCRHESSIILVKI